MSATGVPLPERIPVLLQTYLFADLTPAEVAPLAEDAVMRRYARGEYADHIGAPATHLLVVLHGHFKETVVNAAGHEVITEFYGPGPEGVFGEPALFVPARTRMVNLIALEPARALAIARDRLLRFLLAHPQAMLRLVEGLATEARASAAMVAHMGHLNVRDRVGHRLVELAARFGRASRLGTAIEFPLTHTLLADHVAASRANVSRAIHDLQAAGHVALDGRIFVIHDVDALRTTVSRT